MLLEGAFMRNDFECMTKEELIEKLKKYEFYQHSIDAPCLVNATSDFYEAELLIQNEALRESHQLLEETLDLYTHLYDFAPAGLLTLDEKARIREINLKGANLLQVKRERLIGKPFRNWLSEDSIFSFFSHMRLCKEQKEAFSLLQLSLSEQMTPILLISAPMIKKYSINQETSDSTSSGTIPSVVLDLSHAEWLSKISKKVIDS